MGIRDQEIERIKKYAAGCGVEIRYVKYVRGQDAGAAWYIDGKRIDIFIWSRKTKMQIVLDSIHELGHHKAFIAAGRTSDNDPAKEAIDAEAARKPGDPPIPKHLRKLIYEMELNDAKFRKQIWADLDIKIPKYRFKADMAFDAWYYRHWYKTGKSLTDKEQKAKLRELRRKYKEKERMENGEL